VCAFVCLSFGPSSDSTTLSAGRPICLWGKAPPSGPPAWAQLNHVLPSFPLPTDDTTFGRRNAAFHRTAGAHDPELVIHSPRSDALIPGLSRNFTASSLGCVT